MQLDFSNVLQERQGKRRRFSKTPAGPRPRFAQHLGEWNPSWVPPPSALGSPACQLFGDIYKESYAADKNGHHVNRAGTCRSKSLPK